MAPLLRVRLNRNKCEKVFVRTVLPLAPASVPLPSSGCWSFLLVLPIRDVAFGAHADFARQAEEPIFQYLDRIGVKTGGLMPRLPLGYRVVGAVAEIVE